MILTLSKRQLGKFTTKIRTVTNTSIKIRKYIICILPKCFFEVGHKIMMALEQQSKPPQNLSLIKFHYSGIKIIILPFFYFIKHNHSGSSWRTIKVFYII